MNEEMLAEEEDRIIEGIPLGKVGEPCGIAHAAAYLRDAGHVTGTTICVEAPSS